MSIRVTCQCGQAFSAPPTLAGKTVPCPKCKQPLTVPAAEAAAADLAPLDMTPVAAADPLAMSAPDPFAAGPLGGSAPAADPFGMGAPLGGPALGAGPQPGLGADPFGGAMGGQSGLPGGMPGMQPAPQPQVARGHEESPLIVWLSIGGGALALACVVGFLIYNATQKPPATASTPTTPPAATTPATTTPNSTPSPMPMPTPMGTSPMPMPSPMPSPMPAEPVFTPPSHGQLVGSLSGEYAVWVPGKASEVPESAAQLAGFNPSVLFGDNKPLKSRIAVSTSETFEMTGLAEMQMPAPVAPALLDQVLAGATKQSSADGQVTANKVKHLGRDAVDVTMEREVLGMKNSMRLLTFAEGSSVFTLMWMGAADRAGADDVKTFFASFHKRPPNAPALPPLAEFSLAGLPGIPALPGATSGEPAAGPGKWSFTNPDGSSGVVEQQPDGSWVETRSDNTKFTFKEVSRDDKFVELTDVSRNLSVRLHDDKLEWKGADGQWNAGPTGKWVTRPGARGAGETEFSRVVLGGGEFEIVVPGATQAPREKKRAFLTSSVRGDQLTQTGSTPDGVEFSVTQYELAEEVNDGLLSAKKDFETSGDAKYEQQQIKLAGLDAWQLDGTSADGMPTRKIMFGKGNYFYEIEINGKTTSPAVRTFLASFRKAGSKIEPSPSIPSVDVSPVAGEPAFRLTAEDFGKELKSTPEGESVKKYGGKLIELKGKVRYVRPWGVGSMVLLKNEGEIEIQINFKDPELWTKLAPDQEVTVQGVAIQFSASFLEHGALKKSGDARPVKFTASELANACVGTGKEKEFKAAHEKHQIYVTGKIIDKKFPGYENALVLAAPGNSVVCSPYDRDVSLLDGVKVGDEVTIIGIFIASSPDQITLSDCMRMSPRQADIIRK